MLFSKIHQLIENQNLVYHFHFLDERRLGRRNQRRLYLFQYCRQNLGENLIETIDQAYRTIIINILRILRLQNQSQKTSCDSFRKNCSVKEFIHKGDNVILEIVPTFLVKVHVKIVWSETFINPIRPNIIFCIKVLQERRTHQH